MPDRKSISKNFIHGETIGGEDTKELLSIVDQQFNPPVFLSSFIGGIYHKGFCTTEPESLYAIDINTIVNQVFSHHIRTSFGQSKVMRFTSSVVGVTGNFSKILEIVRIG